MNPKKQHYEPRNIIAKLERFCDLDDDWDEQGAKKPSSLAIYGAIAFAKQYLAPDDWSKAEPMITPDGGVALMFIDRIGDEYNIVFGTNGFLDVSDCAVMEEE